SPHDRPSGSGHGIVTTQTSILIGVGSTFATATRGTERCPRWVIFDRIRRFALHVRFVPKSCREQVQQTMSYSITSSARASSEGGTVMPSALAVLRLM